MPRPSPRSVARSVREVCGGHVFDGHAERLEDRDRRPAPAGRRLSRRQLAQFAGECDPRRKRPHPSATADRRPLRARRRGVDEYARPRDERGVHLALVGAAGADGGDVRAVCHPRALQYGLARRRRHDNEIGAADGVLGRRDRRYRRGDPRCIVSANPRRAPRSGSTPGRHRASRTWLNARRWLRACTPDPRIASTLASSRARSRADTADTAAVRVSVM